MEPHMDLLPPEETRGVFVQDPSVDVPFGFSHAAKITVAGIDRDTQNVADVLSLYDEGVLAVDQQLKRLVGIGLEDTIFVFTSDHGEEFWEHNDFEHGHHLKSVLTDSLIFWGEGIRSGRERTLVVSCGHVQNGSRVVRIYRFQKKVTVRCCLGDPLPAGRMVLSENTLYGDPLLSVVSETHRLEINQESKMAALWTMDNKGMEVEVLSENLDQLGGADVQYIRTIRGNVDTIQQVSWVLVYRPKMRSRT